MPLAITDPTQAAASPGSAEPFPATQVHPADIIRGDVDGVVVCPYGLAAQVIELATKAREVDARCKEDLLAGKGVKDTFAKWRGK